MEEATPQLWQERDGSAIKYTAAEVMACGQ